MKPLILNTSSSLFLARIGLIPKASKYFKIIVPREIYLEMKEGVEVGYGDAKIILGYIEEGKIKITNTGKTKEISNSFRITETDASVIALAQEQKGIAATEDRQIEKIGLAVGVQVINTAVLVYSLWKEKELDTEQASLLLELLLRQGYNKEICLKIKERILREG